jgi:uncharacterized RDD family membrane protein YckC
LTGSSAKPRPEPVAASDPHRVEDVAVGAAAIGFRLAWRVGRVVTLPARVVAHSFLVEPVLRGAGNRLAAAGRDARADGRRRLEATAAGIIAAPETSRTIEHALVQPPPQALNGESLERVAQRALENPTFERILRDAGESRVVRELVDDAVRSAVVQQAVEEILVGPAIRNALARETATFWSEITTRLRERARRFDDRAESAVRRAAPTTAAKQYAGLASRGAALLIDAAITQLAVLVIGALLGFLVSLTAASPDGWLVATLASSGWILFVAAYVVFFWTTAGQTPGMYVLGVRVTDTHGRFPGVGRSLLRFVGLVLAIAPLFAGFLPVLFDARRRALQDFLAATVVVDVELVAAREPAPTLSASPQPSAP